MNSSAAARPSCDSPEVPGSKAMPEVWLRDADGGGARRIPRPLADRLVTDGIARRVSAAGHIRLKVGVRVLPNGDNIHGLPAVEIQRFRYGDAATSRALRHMDRRAAK